MFNEKEKNGNAKNNQDFNHMTDDLKNANFKVDQNFEDAHKEMSREGADPKEADKDVRPEAKDCYCEHKVFAGTHEEMENMNKDKGRLDREPNVNYQGEQAPAGNTDYMVNPGGENENSGYVKNTANAESKAGVNAPGIDELKKIAPDGISEENITGNREEYRNTDSVKAERRENVEFRQDKVPADNTEYMVNPSGMSENSEYVKNSANEASSPGANAPDIHVDEDDERVIKRMRKDTGLTVQEQIESGPKTVINYEPSPEIDDGDVYDEAIDVRALHKDDPNLVDGWTSENPAERDFRIEEQMKREGKLLDYESKEENK